MPLAPIFDDVVRNCVIVHVLAYGVANMATPEIKVFAVLCENPSGANDPVVILGRETSHAAIDNCAFRLHMRS